MVLHILRSKYVLFMKRNTKGVRGFDLPCVPSDDDNKPVRPTSAEGGLAGVRDIETFNRGHTACLRGLSGVSHLAF
jgi:hypothetical protein